MTMAVGQRYNIDDIERLLERPPPRSNRILRDLYDQIKWGRDGYPLVGITQDSIVSVFGDNMDTYMHSIAQAKNMWPKLTPQQIAEKFELPESMVTSIIKTMRLYHIFQLKATRFKLCHLEMIDSKIYLVPESARERILGNAYVLDKLPTLEEMQEEMEAYRY